MSRARAEVASAESWVRAAKVEVVAAQEEVQRAKARVACCEKAVSLSEQAVSLAEEGESSAEEAVNSSERSLELAQAAERLVRVAENEVAAEVEAVESMMTKTQAAQSLTDEAAHHLRTADSAEDSAQLYSTSVQKELEHRAQLLYPLNHPGEYCFPSVAHSTPCQCGCASTRLVGCVRLIAAWWRMPVAQLLAGSC